MSNVPAGQSARGQAILRTSSGKKNYCSMEDAKWAHLTSFHSTKFTSENTQNKHSSEYSQKCSKYGLNKPSDPLISLHWFCMRPSSLQILLGNWSPLHPKCQTRTVWRHILPLCRERTAEQTKSGPVTSQSSLWLPSVHQEKQNIQLEEKYKNNRL